MLATWPLVFGALLLGLIAGVLVPDRLTDLRPSSKSAAQSAVLPAPAKAETVASAPAAGAEIAASESRSAEAKSNETKTSCEEQTWPYLSASCLDRSAASSRPVRIITARPTDPSSAMGGQRNAGTDNAGSNATNAQTKVSNAPPAPKAADTAAPQTTTATAKPLEEKPVTEPPAQTAKATQEPTRPLNSTSRSQRTSRTAATPRDINTERKSVAETEGAETGDDAAADEETSEKPRQPRQTAEPRRGRQRGAEVEARVVRIPNDPDGARIVHIPDDEGGNGDRRIFIQRNGTRIYLRPERPEERAPLYSEQTPMSLWRRW